MDINIELDTASWERALDELYAEYKAAGRDASSEAAHVIRDRTRDKLSTMAHGPFTRTPSPRGMPPALITGELMNSVVVDDTDPDFSEVGPTTRYGRIQELGGWMQGHPYMHWVEDGRSHYSSGHSLPARPYLKPATEEIIDSGDLERIYYDAWDLAQMKVLA